MLNARDPRENDNELCDAGATVRRTNKRVHLDALVERRTRDLLEVRAEFFSAGDLAVGRRA